MFFPLFVFVSPLPFFLTLSSGRVTCRAISIMLVVDLGAMPIFGPQKSCMATKSLSRNAIDTATRLTLSWWTRLRQRACCSLGMTQRESAWRSWSCQVSCHLDSFIVLLLSRHRPTSAFEACSSHSVIAVDHPYYVCVQFHPEFLSRPMRPSPPFLGRGVFFLFLTLFSWRHAAKEFEKFIGLLFNDTISF